MNLKLNYLSAQKHFSKCVRKYRRQFSNKRQLDLLQQQKYNPKVFWKKFSQLGGSGFPSGQTVPDTVINEQGQETSDKEEVLNTWRSHFSNLLNAGTTLPVPSPSCDSDYDTSWLNDPISIEEVKAAVAANINSKSPGLDQIKPDYVKNESCVSFLYKLFNYCFRNAIVPSNWNKSVIKPIPKTSKESKNPNDFRGISLQSVIMKTYCRILNSRLSEWIELNSVLSEEQNGFRPGRCCLDHIFTLSSIVENRMIGNQDTFACFIDFRKAFDSINRHSLWKKLHSKYGINGNFLMALKSMYENVSCTVKVNDLYSDWFDVNTGVKQGCILSPTLFGLYIDDLAKELNSSAFDVQVKDRNVAALLYADDIVVLAPNAENLQTLIDLIHNWCTTWGIKINSSKSNIMHFRKRHCRKPRSSFHFKAGNQTIEYTSEYRYLGYHINEHLDISQTVGRIIIAANRALVSLNHRTKCAGGFHYDTYTMLFNQLVLSRILVYSCIWGHREFPKVKSIQTAAMRFFLGVGTSCPNTGLFGEMGWVPLQAEIKFSIIKFWHRICSLLTHRLPNIIHRWSSQKGLGNWADKAIKLFPDINLSNFNESSFQNEAQNRILHVEYNKWLDNLNSIAPNSESGGRLVLYGSYKLESVPEEYVTRPTSWRRRRTIAQLRCGCLPLEMEIGKYRHPKMPLAQRICQLCNEEIEDETHFLNFCPELTQERIALFKTMEGVC